MLVLGRAEGLPVAFAAVGAKLGSSGRIFGPGRALGLPVGLAVGEPVGGTVVEAVGLSLGTLVGTSAPVVGIALGSVTKVGAFVGFCVIFVEG
jgi:hypothetical protein